MADFTLSFDSSLLNCKQFQRKWSTLIDGEQLIDHNLLGPDVEVDCQITPISNNIFLLHLARDLASRNGKCFASDLVFFLLSFQRVSSRFRIIDDEQQRGEKSI